MPLNTGDPPSHYITEPLNSFAPQKLENGDIRMAIAKAGQHAYDSWGNEATLTKEFLSNDCGTWKKGKVSINHEYNHKWVKAKLYDPVFEEESGLVICSFSGFPDWVISLLYSEDYRGLSQECIPIEFAENSNDVIRGFGTGVTIVTDPFEPAATQEMGVGVRPALAAILASKYPQVEDTMSNNTGGGTPAISTEAYESIALEKVELKSQIQTLESKVKTVETERDSIRSEYESYKAGETNRTDLAYSKGVADGKAELATETEKLAAIKEFTEVHGEPFAKVFMATNPSIEQIKVLTASKKVDLSKGPGTHQSSQPEDGNTYSSMKQEWEAKLGRV